MQQTTEEFIEIAIDVIDCFVEKPNAVWHQIPDGVVSDPDEPWNVTQPQVQKHNIKIVFDLDRLEDRQFLKYLKNRSTNSGQINSIMYGQGFNPKLKDSVRRLSVPDQELVVRAIDPIQPIDLPIIYLMELGT